MKRIELNYQFVLFLYAYLRQMDLSLHRSLWMPWADMKAYYKDQINPEMVAEALRKYTNLNLSVDKKQTYYALFKPTFIDKVCSRFIRITQKKYSMSLNEINYCYQLLYKFSDVLSYDLDVYIMTTETSKIDFSKFYIESYRQQVLRLYSDVLERRLVYRDFNDAMSVEHFYQNEHITVKPIKYFVNGFSL